MKALQKIFIALFFGFLTLSCSKWVEVKPIDRLGEDQLFVNSAGFIKALNGVYVEMANQNLYGQHMSTGALDVMAQYYYIRSSTHVFEKFTLFTYTDANVKSTFSAVWAKAYELIANCNVIVEKCDEVSETILPEAYYNMVKGEALALRAMMHLDMLRLFGPIYNTENKDKPSIPYVNKTGYDVSPLLSSELVMKAIKEDLQQALILLGSDPVRTEGVRNFGNSSGPNDFHYRQYRMNYYAVKALLARAYLWEGDKALALQHAQETLEEVQTEENPKFPYVTFASATNVEKPNRVFSTEVMFSLYDINRSEMFRRLFDVSILPNRKLSFSEADINDTRIRAYYDDLNDYRRRIWQSASNGTIAATTNMKYVDIVDAPGRYMVPLIRISELLLIAAECEPDLAKATAYFNELRTARNAVSLSPADQAALKLEIMKEFRREMLGEGQLFFFYKRNAYQSIPNAAVLAVTPEKTMVLNNYVVPLPDSEISQRN